MKDKKENKLKYIPLILIMLIACIIPGLIIYARYKYLSYYDSAPEMVLANLLFKEKSFFSPNWYYSTEIRFFYQQWIFSPLFLFTDNWRLIRAIGCIICNILLTVSFKYALDSVENKRNKVFNYLFATAINIPVCQAWYWYATIHLFYIPAMITIFVTAGALIRFCRDKKTVHIILPLILAFFTGLSGIRETLILYIPLFASVCLINIRIIDISYKKDGEHENLKKSLISFIKTRAVIFSISVLVTNLIAYVINSKLLASKYSFSTWDKYNLTQPSSERFFDSIGSILAFFGYGDGYGNSVELFSLHGIGRLFAILLFIVTVYIFISFTIRLLREKEYLQSPISILFLTTILAISLHVFIVNFTDVPNEPRYFILAMALIYLIWGIYYCNKKDSPVRKTCVIIIISMALLINGALNISDVIKTDSNGDNLRAAVDFIDSENYVIGYSSFYTGAVIPEISQKHVTMRNISKYPTLKETKWLMEKNPDIASGKAFVLFPRDQYDENASSCNYLEYGKLAYENDGYVIYEFDSNQELLNHIE